MKNYLPISIVLFCFMTVLLSCSSNDDTSIEAIEISSDTTAGNVEITFTTIEISGKVSSNGGNEITARGVCWSLNQNPNINDNKTSEASNSFTSTITDLVANSTYYFRVYATNSDGTSYGTEQSYRTSSLDDTMWDFFFNHTPPDGTWHGDVIFNADGTTIYDEPDDPGMYTTYGTWSLSGNTLSYDFDSSEPTNTSYQFTGTIVGNTMSGVYTWGSSPDKTFTAVKY